MIQGLTILTALVCLLLMGSVLIQNPKGGGIDSTFGGTQANQMLGASNQTGFIEKVTWYLALALLILCLVTSVMVAGGDGSGASILAQ